MTKIRPHLIVMIALLLVVGPWLQAAEISAPSSEQYCDCCQGPCQGCCCSVEEPPAKEETSADMDACHCDLSAVPLMPAGLDEFCEHRADSKPNEYRGEASLRDQQPSDELYRLLASGKSPPRVSSRPAYVLFGALLI
jgi:hypothetical protein